MGETLRDIQKRYATRALYGAMALGIVLMAAGFKPTGKGLILGALFSALNFWLMGAFLVRGGGAGRRLAGVALRMALMAVPLAIAATLPSIDLWGVVPGLLSVPALILLDAGVALKQPSIDRRIQEG
jgi:ATP synthase protein I